MRFLLFVLSLGSLAACGLFPDLEGLSACADGGAGCPGEPNPGGAGQAGAGTAGQAGSSGSSGGSGAGSGGADPGGSGGSAGEGGSAGSSSGAAGAGESGAAGAGEGGAAGAGEGGGAGSAGTAGATGNAGTGGAGEGGAAGDAGASGEGGSAGAAGDGGAGGDAGNAGAAQGGAGTGGASGSTGGGASGDAGQGGVGGAGGVGGTAGTGGTGGVGGAGGESGAGGAGAGGAGDPCGDKGGPPGVEIRFNGKPLYCIDSLETTFAEYQEFIDFTASSSPSQPNTCSWNTDFTWPNWVKSTPNTLPVGGIDWCDAWAYCAFRGKRLCGKVGGDALQLAGMSALQINKESEFARACSANASKLYPYGSQYVGDNCNDSGGTASTGAVPVGSSVACEGGYPGLFDLSGNAQEWINACDTENEDPTKTKCHVAGGTWNYQGNATFCAFSQANPREAVAPQNGVRCCWDPE